jgi:hypothetical protein
MSSALCASGQASRAPARSAGAQCPHTRLVRCATGVRMVCVMTPLITTLSGVTSLWAWLVNVNATWQDKRDTAPLPLLRWSGAVGAFAGQWIAGIPATPGGWVCPGVIAALLILPDAGSITFGGMKVEMRKTKEEVGQAREEVERLGTQVQQLQVQQAAAAAAAAASASGNTMNLSMDALRGTVAATTAVMTGEDTASVPIEQVHSSLDAGIAPDAPPDVPSGS